MTRRARHRSPEIDPTSRSQRQGAWRLLGELVARGAQLRAAGDRLVCKAPRGALLQEHREAVRRSKAALLELLGPGGCCAPLAPVQERLWLVDQLETEPGAGQVVLSWRLDGEVDAAVLGGSLAALARRHEPLRTTFPAIDGRPFQRVAPAPELVLAGIDLGRLEPPDAVAEAGRVTDAVSRLPFDLEGKAPVRAALVKLGTQSHRLLVVLHHIVFDGGSEGVFERDLAALYDLARGGLAALPTLPRTYADYAVAQRERLTGALEGLLEHWCSALRGAPAGLALPVDRPPRQGRRHRSGAIPVALPPPLVEALDRLGREEGASRFMVGLAVLAAMLHRDGGGDDLLIAVPSGQRRDPGDELLVGFFVNTLVVRIDVGGRPSLRGLLRRARAAVLDAVSHQDLPFSRLIEALAPDRQASATPLVQVHYAFHERPGVVARTGGRWRAPRLHPVEVESRHTAWDLAFDLAPAVRGNVLDGRLVYDLELFDPTTAWRMASRWRRLAEAGSAEPDLALARLDVLGRAARHQLLREWSPPAPEPGAHRAGRAEPPGPRDFFDLFAARAAAIPDVTAVVGGTAAAGDQWLSYGALRQRCGELARRLRARGVGAEAAVAVWAERSIDTVVALLAVLEAGGAFVPLDPSEPHARLTAMLDTLRPAVVLVGPGAGHAPPERLAQAVMPITGAPNGPALAKPEVPIRDLDDPRAAVGTAYVIFTSGSTGRPKGVVISRGALAARLHEMQAALPLSAEDRLVLKTPLVFDPAVWELLAPLLVGGRSVVAPRRAHLDPAELAATVELRRASVLQLVPTQLQALVATPGFARCRSLQKVCCGGEAFSRALWHRLAQLGLGVEVLNFYGPTEATINASYLRVQRGRRPPPGAVLAIGRPFEQTPLRVLDPELRPLAIGIAGELAIGGPGLARGYFGRAAETARSFVPEPWGDLPGERLYRSGDLVRWRGDGLLEHLGRFDRQLKLHGLRVELGEIEAALARHPAVRQAVVVAHAAGSHRELVAFVVPAAAGMPSLASWREYLASRLPRSLRPERWVELADLPRLASGKADRQALARRLAEPSLETDRAPPHRTPTEEILSEMWCDVLGVRRADPGDSFFEIGGHSLLAALLLARLRDAFGVELELRLLFEGPTLAELAQVVDAARGVAPAAAEGAAPGRAAPMRAPIRRRGVSTAPLSFSQERIWRFEERHPGAGAYHLPFARRLRGPLATGALVAALDEVVRRHEILRMGFVRRGGVALQVVQTAVAVPWIEIDLGGLPPRRAAGELRRVARELAERPFDLQRWPLLRAVVLRVHREDHVLLVVLHHLLADGWTLGLLELELGALYGAAVADRAMPLPPPELGYTDWSLWQREVIRGPAGEGLLTWWHRQLAGLEAVRLPARRPSAARRRRPGGVIDLELPAALSAALRTLVRRLVATPFMVLSAAAILQLCALTGRRDVTLGTSIARRSSRQLEGLFGFCSDIVVLRAPETGDDPSFETFLARFRTIFLDAFAHQDLPLIELIRARGTAAEPPLPFPATLSYHTAAGRPWSSGPLEVEPFAVDYRRAHFDLSWHLWEHDLEVDGLIAFDADLFEPATVRAWAEDYRSLLGAVAEDTRRRVDDLLETLRGGGS